MPQICTHPNTLASPDLLPYNIVYSRQHFLVAAEIADNESNQSTIAINHRTLIFLDIRNEIIWIDEMQRSPRDSNVGLLAELKMRGPHASDLL